MSITREEMAVEREVMRRVRGEGLFGGEERAVDVKVRGAEVAVGGNVCAVDVAYVVLTEVSGVEVV